MRSIGYGEGDSPRTRTRGESPSPGLHRTTLRVAEAIRPLPASGARSAKRPRRISSSHHALAAPLLLDHIPDHRRNIRPIEPRDGADAGRRGHVDLGQKTVDAVDADEQQPAAPPGPPTP